jgi:hypothetical protein
LLGNTPWAMPRLVKLDAPNATLMRSHPCRFGIAGRKSTFGTGPLAPGCGRVPDSGMPTHDEMGREQAPADFNYE